MDVPVSVTEVLGIELDADFYKTAAIPFVAAVIGYVTNWVAIKMMFWPIEFVGVWRKPLGWQGVIPSKARKMGSISVDKGIAKLGNLSEFYTELDPSKLAEHILEHSGDEIRLLFEEIVAREHPQMWADMPPRMRELMFGRVKSELPKLIHEVTRDIGEHIDDMMDLKLMVIEHLEHHPELACRIFQDTGENEFRFIVRSGAYFGFALGLLQMALWIGYPASWVLPVAGLLVGYLTNKIALTVIFNPVEPRKFGPVTIWGLFMKRRDEVADIYSRLIADHIITMRNMVHNMLTGTKADRTKRLLTDKMRPAIDNAVGAFQPMLRVAVGVREYDSIRDSMAVESAAVTLDSLSDEAFGRERSDAIQGLIAQRMRSLPPTDFADMLRSAFKEDEWQLITVGAFLGFWAGVGQLVFVFGGSP